MLQAGFGMNAFQSGSVTFIASVGAMAMKATAAPILRMFGFRRVLVYDAILSAAFLACYGFFTPVDAGRLLMMSVLLVGGFVRSLEFTSLNAIVFAEIDPSKNEQSRQFFVRRPAIVARVLASRPVPARCKALPVSTPARDVLAPENFKWAFVAMALISLSAAAAFLRLPADAGAELIATTRSTAEAIAPAGAISRS